MPRKKDHPPAENPKPSETESDDPAGEPRRIESDPALNNPDATPGTGMLPPLDEEDTNPAPSG